MLVYKEGITRQISESDWQKYREMGYKEVVLAKEEDAGKAKRKVKQDE